MKKTFIIIALLAFSFSHSLSAWWDGGHMAVAQIAYDHLNDDVREKVDALCAEFSEFYPEMSSFVTASIWLDEIKYGDHFPLMDRYHFIEMPYDPEALLGRRDYALLKERDKQGNIIQLIQQACDTLSRKEVNRFAKAIMLRALIHCVADIHQPMHCCSLYSKDFPKGDRGGNYYLLHGDYPQLHALWDAGAGAFTKMKYMEEPFDTKELANQLVQEWPQELFPQLEDKAPSQWANESHQMAIHKAYQTPFDEKPSQEYLDSVQLCCKKQVTLAGYRLAEMLNSLDF